MSLQLAKAGVWFIYIRPEGGDAPPEPSKASDFEDVFANVFHCYRLERGMLGHVMMTTTPPKEKQKNHLPEMECRTSQIFIGFIIGTLNMQSISLDLIITKQRM